MAANQPESGSHAGAGGAVPCANMCGFFGTAATKNLCSRCYWDHLNAVANAGEAEKMRALLASLARREMESCPDAASAASPAAEKTPATKTNRCAACRKKVGLLGFACRCGGNFCSVHRHASAHSCGFDYKAAGRKRIEEENPVIVAAKIQKI